MSQPTRLSQDELQMLTCYVQAIAPIAADEVKALSDLAWVRDLTRGEHLLRSGDIATQTGIVVRGLLREYFVMSDGTERTKAFVREAQATGSLADLVSGRPSRAFIVAEEPVRVLLLEFSEVRALFERSQDWLRWSVRLLELMFVGKVEREYELLGLDADERYALFSERYPALEARVAAKHVASYLGITPVHLSRLRRRRARGCVPVEAQKKSAGATS